MEHEHALDTQEAAVMLSRSPRWIRLHGAELGGRKVVRDWVFDGCAVQEHLEGKSR